MSDYDTWPPACRICGEFISLDDLERAVEYVPYSFNPASFDPGSAKTMHAGCWEGTTKERRDRIRDIAWQGPYRDKMVLADEDDWRGDDR